MSEGKTSDTGMFNDFLGYVLEKTRHELVLRLKDPGNAEIASIFDSQNHQTLFSKIESGNLNKHDYSVFMEFYFSGETGVSPPGVPHEFLPNRQNSWDSSGLRSFFGTNAEKNRPFTNDLDPAKLKQAWIELYSSPEKSKLSEIPDIQASLERFLHTIPKQGQEEIWLSNVCFLLRKSVRLYYKQGSRRKSIKKKLDRENSEPEIRLDLSWLLELFRKGQRIGESFESILAQQATFLFCYEQAVVFNYLGAHDRALDKLEEAVLKSKHQPKWESSDVIHPVLEDPTRFCKMSINLTRSWCGKSVEEKSIKETIDFAIARSNSSEGSDVFVKNSAAVLHFYSLLSLFNDGSLSSLTGIDPPWERFRKMHSTFCPKRTMAYIELSKSPSHPWTQQLCDGYKGLFTESKNQEQQQTYLETLVKNSKQVWGKNLDLSINNPISSYTATNSSFADQINDWSAYLDMIHINQLRTTKGGSHHFDHFGPLKEKDGNWFWIKGMSSENKEQQQGRYPYPIEQYLSQSFRLSTKPKSTKMDRINLMATVIKQLANTLEKYVPKDARNLVEGDVLNRLQKPILIPEEYLNLDPNLKGDQMFVSLHRHIGIDRVLSLNTVLSSVESMLQLASIQQSYRHGVELILKGFQEQLGLEFVHLMLCVRVHVQTPPDFFAGTLVLNIRERISKETLFLNHDSLSRQIKDLKIKHNDKQRLEERLDSSNIGHLQEDINGFQRLLEKNEDKLERIVLELASKYKTPRDKIDIVSPSKSRENQLLKSDFLGFEFKQFGSPQGYFDRYINETRAESILSTLSDAPWWKYDLATFTEEQLAQTMVAWIRHRANEEPIPLIHPRSRGGK